MYDEPPAKDLRPIGLWVFLAALTTLLGASIIGYLVVRLRAPVWPPEGVPLLPGTLWISTVILLVGSLTVHVGVSALRAGNQPRFRAAFGATFALGLGFLVSQVLNGHEFFRAIADRPKELYSFTYLMLAGLHAVHLLGGLIPLGIVTRRAYRGRYSTENPTAPKLVATYWHYLDGVWLLMFVLLIS
jgi:heme/copper-type cytochrome/quinol oxidase subunit 3